MVSSLESSSQSSLLGGLLGGSTDRISFSTGEVTSEEALATLTSRKFVEGFIDDNNALKIIFFESWDDTKDEWKIELDEVPSISDGYDLIVNNLDISLDNSLITVEFLFGNKEVASILNSLIYDVNSYIRKESISDSQSNISFLQKEIEKTQLSASREMLYRIVEQQTQSIMLANTREDYAFKIIDPAIEPKNPAGPNRKLIVIIGLLLGSLISVIAVIFINFFK
jgi:LPS O-antigen subunit length determinant protein (WzzB/FepE family)